MRQINRDRVVSLKPGTVFLAIYQGREDLYMMFNKSPSITVRKVVDELFRERDGNQFITPLCMLHEKTSFYLPTESELNTMIGALLSSQQQMKQ